MQANFANAEMTQLDSQLIAATDDQASQYHKKEVTVQNIQITNAEAVSGFLATKYTNAQLYLWMVTQLTTVYTQAYQLVFASRCRPRPPTNMNSAGPTTISFSLDTGTTSTRG